jgi:ribosomal protein S18 acetylase RimI-like enzyme
VVDGPAVTLVACEADRVLGYASLGPARDADAVSLGELWALYVAPEAWGSGVGASLLAAVDEALAARGFPEVVLWVLEANRRARRFYEKHGFELDGGRTEPIEAGWILPHLRYRRVITAGSRATSSTP